MKVREPSRNSFQVHFGQLVRARRLKRGWTLMDLALRVFGDEERVTGVADVESGRYEPKSNKIDLFCAALEISKEEVEALRAIPPWPRVVSAGTGLERTVLGRQADMASLRAAFSYSTSNDSAPSVVLRGSPGIGKSTIARYYLHAYWKHYLGICWIRSESRQTIVNDLCSLALFLNPAERAPDRETLAKATLTALQSTQDPWLLVFDNATDPQVIREWRPENGNIHCLVTSQSGNWPPGRYVVLRTEVLSKPVAADLLMREASRSDDRAGAAILAVELDRLPLALIVAAAWLRDRPSVSFRQYAEDIEQRLSDIPDTVTDYSNSVFAAISRSISDLSSDACALLNIISFLAPDRISFEAFQNFTANKVERRWLQSRASHELQFLTSRSSVEAAFAELERASLLELTDNVWSVHRTVQTVCRKLQGDRFAFWLSIAAGTVAQSYPSGGDQNPQFVQNWPKCEMLNPHVEQLFRHRPASVYGAEFEHVFSQAALYFWMQGRTLPAIRYALVTLRSRLSRPETDPRDIGEAYNNLAAYLGMRGKLLAASYFSSKAIEICASHPQISPADQGIWTGCRGYVLNEVALRKQKYGAIEEAARFATESRRSHHKALALHRLAFGKHSRQTGIHLRNIAKTKETLGRTVAALALHRTALSIRRKSLPSADPDLGISLVDVGSLLIESGHAASARELLLEANRIFEAAYPDNPAGKWRLLAAQKLAVCNAACASD